LAEDAAFEARMRDEKCVAGSDGLPGPGPTFCRPDLAYNPTGFRTRPAYTPSDR